MSKYKTGTYFKNWGTDKQEKIVVNDDTPDEEVEKFMKGCEEGTVNEIKKGNSEGSRLIRERMEQRKKEMKAKQAEEDKRIEAIIKKEQAKRDEAAKAKKGKK